MNRFTQHSLNTPAFSHAAQEGVVANTEATAPFTQRHNLAIVCDTGVRLPWGFVGTRGLDGPFNAPAIVKSFAQTTGGNADSFSPICHAQSFPFVCQHHISASVSVLLLWGFPAAVARFVVAVVRDSAYRVLFAWPFPHVLEKRLERLPPFADLDPATTVEFPVFAIRVSAAPPHVCPYLIFSGVRHPVFASVALLTSHDFASEKVFARGNSFVATFADAPPENTTILIPADAFNDCQPAERLAGYVFEASAALDRIGISHVSAPLSERNVVRAETQLELRFRSLLLQNHLAA